MYPLKSLRRVTRTASWVRGTILCAARPAESKPVAACGFRDNPSDPSRLPVETKPSLGKAVSSA